MGALVLQCPILLLHSVIHHPHLLWKKLIYVGSNRSEVNGKDQIVKLQLPTYSGFCQKLKPKLGFVRVMAALLLCSALVIFELQWIKCHWWKLKCDDLIPKSYYWLWCSCRCVMCRSEAHQLYARKPIFDAHGIQLVVCVNEHIDAEVWFLNFPSSASLCIHSVIHSFIHLSFESGTRWACKDINEYFYCSL